MIIKLVHGCLLLLGVALGLGQTRIDLGGQARNIDFGDAIVTKPFVVGATLPAACTIGEAFFKSDAAPGENLFLCTAINNWVLSGPAAPYTQEFVTPTAPWNVAGAVHGLGTEVEVFVQEDGGTNWKRAFAGSVMIGKASGDVTVDWSEPRKGRILISQLRGGRGGGSASGEAGPHAPTHRHGGTDEIASTAALANAIPKADTIGKLSIDWIPQGSGTDLAADLEEESHAGEHKHGGSDEIASVTPGANEIPKADGTGKLPVGWIPQGSGTDLTADLEEESHAGEHKHGGSDEIASATPGANEIPKADAAGKLPPGWIPQGSGTDLTADLEEELHAGEHKHGGSDEIASATPGANEIPKADASGKLTSGWIPQGSGTDLAADLEEESHAGEHKHGGSDEIASATPGANEIPKADGTGKLPVGWIPQGSGTDLTADLEEESHAGEHKHGGSDEIASATPGANEIPKADAAGKLPPGWIPQGSGTDLTADLEEESHADEHKHGGSDEIASAAPGANEIPKADAAGKLTSGWIPQGSGTDLTADLEEESHAGEHKHGGSDEIASATPGANEIPKADAAGKLMPGWIPQGSGTDLTADLEEESHADEHKHGGSDEIASVTPGANEIPKADGTGKLPPGWIPQGSGTDLTADLEEELHAGEHKHGGSDEIASATPGANEIPKADAAGKLTSGWIPQGSGTDLTADLEEESHADEHKHGGTDEVATAIPAANAIPKADATGKLNSAWLPQSSTLTAANHMPFVGNSAGVLSIDTTPGKEFYREPSSGYFGISTTAPGGKLEVQSETGSTAGLILKTTDGGMARRLTEWRASNGTAMAGVNGDGTLSLGTAASPAAALYRLTISGASKNTIFYGLNTNTIAANDTINYAAAGNAVSGIVNGFDYSVNASSGFNSTFSNLNNINGAAHTRFEVRTTGANGGDPKFVYTIIGVRNWSTGIDNSDGDKFKISASDSPGNMDVLTIDTSGNVGVGTANPQSSLHVPDGKYSQFEDNNTGPPPTGDCDAAAELGRLSIDTSNARLYVCLGTSGWKYMSLN